MADPKQRNDGGIYAPATGIYRMPSGRYLKTMAMMFGRSFGYAAGVALLMAVVLGLLVDWRCFLIALMMVLLICPAVMAWLYFYYGLRPECFINVMPHYISRRPDGISVTMLKRQPKDLEDDNEGKDSEETEEDAEYEEVDYSFNFCDIRRKNYIVGNDGVTFPLVGKYRGFLWIPEDAFADAEEFINFVSWMSDMDI